MTQQTQADRKAVVHLDLPSFKQDLEGSILDLCRFMLGTYKSNLK